jgi:hypothetical protein
MLGQHPELYGFPELNLFLTRTVAHLLQLDDTMSHVTGRQFCYTFGLTRAVAQMRFDSQSEDALVQAVAWLKDRARWNTSHMFRYLLRLAGPRIGVDKSPRTCLSTRSLHRALEFHSNTRFMHLTRDPVNAIRSLVESFNGGRPFGASACSTRERAGFAVQLWCFCQETILRETAGLPSQRFLRVRSEDLLDHPDSELPRICRWLGVRDDREAIEPMLQPECSPYAYPIASLNGQDQDPAFLTDPRLRPAQPPLTPDLPESWDLEPQHSSTILALGRTLGYADCARQNTPAKPI